MSPRDRAAMSIVEVLCAVTLLSFLLLPLFQLVLNSSADTRRSELHLQALCLAQRQLEEALLLGPADAGLLPETDAGRFHLKVAVTPFLGNEDLHDFAVTVSWDDGRGRSKREVRLRTLTCRVGL